jgi:hypothetical protein
MTPADRRAQRLVTVVAGSGRTEKQEAIIEPGDDLLDRHGAQPHGGEFEGERMPSSLRHNWTTGG